MVHGEKLYSWTLVVGPMTLNFAGWYIDEYVTIVAIECNPGFVLLCPDGVSNKILYMVIRH